MGCLSTKLSANAHTFKLKPRPRGHGNSHGLFRPKQNYDWTHGNLGDLVPGRGMAVTEQGAGGGELTEDTISIESDDWAGCWLTKVHDDSLLAASVVKRRCRLARTSVEGRCKADMRLP